MNTADIEKRIKQLRTKLNNKSQKKNKFIDNRVWTQKTNNYVPNLISVADNKKKEIEKGNLKLREQNQKTRKDTPLANKSSSIEEKNDEKTKVQISNYFENLLNYVENNLNQIKDRVNDLSNFNGIYLQKSASNFYKTSKPRTINYSFSQSQKFFAERPLNSPFQEKNNVFCTNNSKTKAKINDLPQKKNPKYSRCFSGKDFSEGIISNLNKIHNSKNSKLINYNRLHELYRVQINRELRAYKPLEHLKDMLKIQNDDMEVRQKIQDIKKEIDKKVELRCKGKYFKKEYDNFIKKNKSSKDNNMKFLYDNMCFFEHKEEKMKRPLSSFKLRKNYSSLNLFEAKAHNLQKQKKKNKKRKNATFQEKIERDNEILENILVQLQGTLEKDPIIKYIDKCKEQSIKKDDKEKIKEHFFPQYQEIDKYMERLLLYKIYKQTMTQEEVEKKIQKKKKDLIKSVQASNEL